MSKRIDDFIRNNREDFDDEVPSAQVWNQIDQRLAGNIKKAKVVSFRVSRIAAAAAVLLLLTAGALYWFNSKPNTTGPSITKTEQTVDPAVAEKALLNEINPAYAKELYHFTQLIELKQGELKLMEKENPQLYKQFVSEINKLDSSYIALKQELPANPNREQLLEAMIRNLQVQMDLLNQQLLIIQQIKQSKNKSNDGNSKSI